MSEDTPASARDPEHRFDYDVLVIGSGFGGSVTALRLTEKGYRVGVLEAGRRFTPETLPTSSWDVRNFLWAPRLGCYGIQRIHVLKDVVILAGAGVGGGSLNYANTLYRPTSESFYRDPQWADITDWRSELDPFYEQAQRMLGVVTQPTVTAADVAMRTVAEEAGRGQTFGPTRVGVFYGRNGSKEPGRSVADPYFGGVGPTRRGCIECGSCMTGCRYGAKNTLDLNYLALAENAGADVHAETTATEVAQRTGGGYAVTTRPTRGLRRRAHSRQQTITAEHVVFAAGTWGTQTLLHRMRDTGVLPRLSDRLGSLTRTNSESLVSATARHVPESGPDTDLNRGVAITSSWHPDDDTHVEPCRYGKSSNAMGMLLTVMTDGEGRWPRPLRALGQMARHPRRAARSVSVRRWSERTIIGLVMQSLDNSITVRRSRRGWLTSGPGHGAPNPTWIPAANHTARRLAELVGGDPGGSLGELVNVPMTAHFIGGCPIGSSPDRGVIDGYHRVYGYPGLHVVDGSALSANLGVNPSLSITAQAERAMAFWPNKGETDARPPLGESYQWLDTVAPHWPAVPEHPPAALHLGIPGVPARMSVQPALDPGFAARSQDGGQAHESHRLASHGRDSEWRRSDADVDHHAGGGQR